MSETCSWNTEPWLKHVALTIEIRREDNRWCWTVCYGDRSHDWGSSVDYKEASRDALLSFQRHEVIYP